VGASRKSLAFFGNSWYVWLIAFEIDSRLTRDLPTRFCEVIQKNLTSGSKALCHASASSSSRVFAPREFRSHFSLASCTRRDLTHTRRKQLGRRRDRFSGRYTPRPPVGLSVRATSTSSIIVQPSRASSPTPSSSLRFPSRFSPSVADRQPCAVQDTTLCRRDNVDVGDKPVHLVLFLPGLFVRIGLLSWRGERIRLCIPRTGAVRNGAVQCGAIEISRAAAKILAVQERFCSLLVLGE